MNATTKRKAINRIQSERIFEGTAPANPIKDFFTEVLDVTVAKIVGFVKGVYEHIETISVLTLASFGLAFIHAMNSGNVLAGICGLIANTSGTSCV